MREFTEASYSSQYEYQEIKVII
eukprot:COSAG02_NODE_9265_length_2271_cov_2.328427_3_plen_22_part_01